MQDAGQRNPVVSVIIPCYKRAELTEKTIQALFHQDLDPADYEVLVVDTSPDNAIIEMVERLRPAAPFTLRWFKKEPEGPGPSRNLGARHARGRYFAFLDNDVEAAPGWLRAGLAAFDNGIGLVQGRTEPDPSARRSVFTRYIQVQCETPVYEACNIFYRREAFEEVGGFWGRDLTATASTPMGGEDIDLAWKVKRKGWKSTFAGDALVYHAVIPISKWQWLYAKQLYVFPKMVKEYPELRPYMFGRYFYNRAQAFLVLLFAGLALALYHPAALALAIPYVAARVSEPSATLKGPLRLVRAAIYAPRDCIWFLFLLAGSLRYRSLLL